MHKISHHSSDSSYKSLQFAIVLTVFTLFVIVTSGLFNAFHSPYKDYIYSFIIILTIFTLATTAYSFLSFRNISMLKNTRSRKLETTNLDNIFDPELEAEFVKDTSEGIFYQRLIDLVRNAKNNITIVSTLEGNDYGKELQKSYVSMNLREEYYIAIKNQIYQHRGKAFYQEIVQIPFEFESNHLSKFRPFQAHLWNLSELQRNGLNSVVLRITSGIWTNPFIIIDDKYVVFTISYGISYRPQIRQGILILEDHQGEFVSTLKLIFEKLKDHSEPLGRKFKI